jgi:DivIVA domain-containing protein
MILLYLVVLILVATVLFGVGSVLFGRGERLPPLPRATTATALPASGVTGADVDAVKFTQTMRGYKTGEVDWVLDRLGQELDLLRGELSAVRAAYGIPEYTGADDSGDGAHALPDELAVVPAGTATADESGDGDSEGAHAQADEGSES